MTSNIAPGAVIFTGDPKGLARFYGAVTGLPVRLTDGDLTVLGSDAFEIVFHPLSAKPPVGKVIQETTMHRRLLAIRGAKPLSERHRLRAEMAEAPHD